MRRPRFEGVTLRQVADEAAFGAFTAVGIVAALYFLATLVGVAEEYREGDLTRTGELPLMIAAAAVSGSLAAAYLWYLVRREIKARRRPGACAGCGYDLRASRVRCPECGEPIPEVGASVRP